MRSKGLTTILALFFGFIGVHRFYLGQRFLGILYIVLFFVFGLSLIISLIDVLGFLFMSRERFDYLYNRKYFESDYLDFLKKRENLYKSGPPVKEKAKNIPRKRVTNPQEGIRQLKAQGKLLFSNYEYEEAVEVFEQVLAFNSRDAAIHFNLACCFSLLENKERALRHLALAIETGFDNFEKLQNHPALAWIRIQEEWKEFKEKDYKLAPPAIKEKSAESDFEIDVSKKSMEDELNIPEGDKLLVKLKKLKDLRDRGLISDNEFIDEKKKIL